jgi:hypothetical protein
VRRSREIAAELFADFVQFHGSDLAVFLDGSSSFFPVDDKDGGRDADLIERMGQDV